mgnify:FL=1
MPILILKLLGISAWIKKGAYALLCGIKRYPLHAALLASMCFSGWLWRGKQSALAERDAARDETAQVIKAGQQALAAQIKLHDETKAAYAAKAKEANDDYAKDLAAASTAADRYANANRVRKVCVSRPSETSVSAENSDPGVLEVPATEALVAITRADFDKCTALYPYANGAYKWGVVLREAGLGE